MAVTAMVWSVFRSIDYSMETGGTEMASKKRRFTAEFKGRVALEAQTL